MLSQVANPPQLAHERGITPEQYQQGALLREATLPKETQIVVLEGQPTCVQTYLRVVALGKHLHQPLDVGERATHTHTHTRRRRDMRSDLAEYV